ncbi:MAG: exodeoxyribonuclease VII small subunit [Candidatus Omnitrophota bacterium]
MTEIKFEKAIEQLEKIVAELEGEELSLEDSLKKYEEGIKLIRLCSKKLDEAKKKIQLLSKKGAEFDLSAMDEVEDINEVG